MTEEMIPLYEEQSALAIAANEMGSGNTCHSYTKSGRQEC